MKNRPQFVRKTVPYLVAVFSVAAALLLTGLLWPWIEPHPTSLFLAAITVSAWYGGFQPSLLATALATIAVDYFFIFPVHSLEVSIDNTVRAGVFVLVALLISWIDHARKKAIEERDQMLVREQEARKAAETVNQTKDEFLAMVSHELRTPLNVISGWVSMLRSGKLNGEAAADALERVERNARLQQHLIEDLIDVSRIASGTMRVEPRPMEVSPVIEEGLRTVALAAKAKDIAIYAEYPDEAIIISGDPDRFQQVVWNLLSNAIKFTPPRGRISLSLERLGGDAILSVRDSGRGIRPDFLPYVFERFRQDVIELGQNHEGLGVGLSIVRHIVELHGGSIEAESAGKDQGATFRVCIPLATKELRNMFPATPSGSRNLKKVKATNLAVSANASAN
ncbi:MAG TPA: HAMP domain-containing sensor histidine kinase [Pyrinomonadaceae bacterium]|nr:HAMP domain-containing sensor histidine kinase [Pyrinomonadaceae bacterium]